MKSAAALIGLTLAGNPVPTPALVLELRPLDFLVGSCWRATMPGTQGTDTHCFTRMLDGHFVRDRHRLSGVAYAGESIYRWDAGSRQIRFDYYQSEGLLISGTAAPTPNGLAFALSALAAGRTIELRATWTRDGPNAYVVAQEIREGESWRPVPDHPRFERIGPSPAD